MRLRTDQRGEPLIHQGMRCVPKVTHLQQRSQGRDDQCAQPQHRPRQLAELQVAAGLDPALGLRNRVQGVQPLLPRSAITTKMQHLKSWQLRAFGRHRSEAAREIGQVSPGRGHVQIPWVGNAALHDVLDNKQVKPAVLAAAEEIARADHHGLNAAGTQALLHRGADLPFHGARVLRRVFPQA